MTGQALKTALGLNKFQYCYIQKILGISLSVFVVTVDSRRPKIYLSRTRVSNSTVTTIEKAQVLGLNSLKMKKYQFTIPVLIETTTPIISSGSLIIRRDISADYWIDKKMFENKNFKEIEVIKWQ